MPDEAETSQKGKSEILAKRGSLEFEWRVRATKKGVEVMERSF